jgi:hypothetical protein
VTAEWPHLLPTTNTYHLPLTTYYLLYYIRRVTMWRRHRYCMYLHGLLTYKCWSYHRLFHLPYMPTASPPLNCISARHSRLHVIQPVFFGMPLGRKSRAGGEKVSEFLRWGSILLRSFETFLLWHRQRGQCTQIKPCPSQSHRLI